MKYLAVSGIQTKQRVNKQKHLHSNTLKYQVRYSVNTRNLVPWWHGGAWTN